MLISVIGESKATDQNYSIAEKVGVLIARSGATLVCGGLDGVMEAACKGAKSAGGSTIGILPGLSKNEANQWIDIPICTGLGDARNIVVVRTGSAVIAIGGAYGTLSEIGHALSDGKPIFALNSWEITKSGIQDPLLTHCKNEKEAVEKALASASGG
ncbi:MAG: TIGR00725 family protein [Dehalococcoidia bacterium]